MLSEYARYIENIRNSLMQCGVIFPQIDNIESSDYGILFHISEKLDDVMYFYKIMACSGNMEEMFLPLDKSYRGFVRMEAFNEFKEDILPSLKEMFGDEDESDNFNFGVLLDIEGTEEVGEEPEEWVNEDLPDEDIIFDEDDLFGNDSDEENDLPSLIDVEEQFVSSGARLWGAKSTDGSDFVSCGTDLFSVNKHPMVDVISEENDSELLSTDRQTVEVEWVSNGVELFSIQLPDVVNSSEETWEPEYDDMQSSESSFESEDVFSDDEDVWVEDNEETAFESEDVFSDDEDVWVDEPESDVFSDDEDVWVEDNEEDIWDDEPEEVTSTEDIWEDSEEDIWDDEPEEVTSTEDSWVEGTEEESFSGDLFTDDEDIWVDEPDKESLSESDGSSSSCDIDIWEEPPKSVVKNPVSTPASGTKTSVTPIRTPSRDRDIVDSMQEAASIALTGAKRFLLKLTKPEE